MQVKAKENILCFLTGVAWALLCATLIWLIYNVPVFRHGLFIAFGTIVVIWCLWLVGFALRSAFEVGGIHTFVKEDMKEIEKRFSK